MAASPGRPKSAKQSDVDALAEQVQAIKVQLSEGGANFAHSVKVPSTDGVLGEEALFTGLFMAVVRAEGYSAIGKRAMKDTTEQVAFASMAYYTALGLHDRAAAARARFLASAAEFEANLEQADSPKAEERRGFEPHQDQNVPEKTKTPGPGEVRSHNPKDYFKQEQPEAVAAE